MADEHKPEQEVPDESMIRLATSIPSLKNKIQTNIKTNSDIIYWYIRFNIPLDERTISEKTMGVTDTSGYIMRTDISYDADRNVITISPLDSYEQNRYYILRISKKVKSRKGQGLKSNINILFKLMNSQISNFKILRKEEGIAPARKRPTDYDQKYTRSKVYSFNGNVMENVKQDKLPTAELNINPLLGLFGIVLLAVAIVLKNFIFIGVAVVVCAAGLFYIIKRMQKKEVKSLRTYNKGAKKFNSAQYADAKAYFTKALIEDDTNEYAEYAVNKTEFYN